MDRLAYRIWYRFYKKGWFKNLPDDVYLKWQYRVRLGKKLHLKSPALFTEKLQWLKLYDRKPIYTDMVDKYKARAIVAQRIGEQYLVPLLGVWDKPEDIDFAALPAQYVIKCTHDSGGLIICTDKAAINEAEAKQKLARCLKHDYYQQCREWPYKDIERRVIAEEYMENGAEGLHDYKIWCFGGRAVYIQYITGRVGKTYEAFYDRQWVKQNFTYHNPMLEGEVPKPRRLEELISLAEKLAIEQPFLRCDFYVLKDDSIRFGEMTFFPVSGMEFFHPTVMDKQLGELLLLPERWRE